MFYCISVLSKFFVNRTLRTHWIFIFAQARVARDSSACVYKRIVGTITNTAVATSNDANER